MNDIKMTNIPSMAVDKMVNQLSRGIQHCYQQRASDQNNAFRYALGTSPVLVNRRQFVRLQMKLA